ncbi:hypothetical protein [Bordetella bronchiseptica]|uniref:hypothetical protein n=1 Tax=Bordetella bronchiseptica TaxID=518 RepID=UPI0002DCD570|nr:hypothetical protein [Bordetella bronchiseptica]KDD31749.1 hypothetical protein L528_2233 [Bordetella bronchiseptica MBORD849]KDD39468.1 hypothetical protein L527_2096 [Bordetella bronchiseptica MBORD839]WLS60426.1 hypothetical protein RAK14_07040 [Bordetella bronchiseptica]WLS61572.1 hypothetical protein RAK14_24420 [Bordetella bronchiseptica]WLS65260.1 hypothetical protein RAK11_07040 [Bordetella bronchiseptica]
MIDALRAGQHGAGLTRTRSTTYSRQRTLRVGLLLVRTIHRLLRLRGLLLDLSLSFLLRGLLGFSLRPGLLALHRCKTCTYT